MILFCWKCKRKFLLAAIILVRGLGTCFFVFSIAVLFVLPLDVVCLFLIKYFEMPIWHLTDEKGSLCWKLNRNVSLASFMPCCDFRTLAVLPILGKEDIAPERRQQILLPVCCIRSKGQIGWKENDKPARLHSPFVVNCNNMYGQIQDNVMSYTTLKNVVTSRRFANQG